MGARGATRLVRALARLRPRDRDRDAADLVAQQRELDRQRMQFVRTVSHEFRTPLTVVRGVAETFERRSGGLDPDLRPLCASLARAAARLEDMVTVVLAAGNALDTGLRQSQHQVDLELLVEELTHDLAVRGARSRVRLLPPRSGTATVTTIDAYLRLLLRLLLDNALKFSPDDRPVDVAISRRGRGVEIRIRDHGPGIDPGFLGRAFDPFTQQDGGDDRRHDGLGLGLYASRQLADQLDASLEVAPHPDGGTLATVRLPQRRLTDGPVPVLGSPEVRGDVQAVVLPASLD